jgi:hypothetical protein
MGPNPQQAFMARVNFTDTFHTRPKQVWRMIETGFNAEYIFIIICFSNRGYFFDGQRKIAIRYA